jgi:ribosomal peptide maturation radical SAM protein 1
VQVALVHPPFAPAGLPSLGLGLLQAGVRGRGIGCRTFYWGLDLVPELPGGPEERAALYDALTSRRLHPFNEWTFARVLHGDALPERLPEIQSAYLARHGTAAAAVARGRHILALRERADELVDRMADRLAGFDLVGISSTFFQNTPALALARRVKQRWPDKPVVLGGANTDGGMGQALLELFPFLDAVFEGEVDHAFPEFVARMAAGSGTDDVPGLIRRDPLRGLVAGPKSSPLADLDSLPIPDFEDYIEAFHASGLDRTRELTLPLESSRGCWWGERQHCTFCGLNAEGMGYRTKSAERFFAEVETVVARHGARFLFMTDNILAPRYDRSFAEWAQRRQVGVDFFYEIKANVRRAQVERLAAAGVTAVQPGIESFSGRVLDLIRKGVTPLQNIAFLKHARELGLLPAYNLLVGVPGESAEDYAPLLTLLPKLAHLHPPAAVAPIEFHRFSPYQRDPASFGLELRAASDYSFLHPLQGPELARIAYFFEDARGGGPGAHVRPFGQAVLAWCRAYREDDCLLTWQRDGEDVLVDDRRPAFGPRRLRLRGFAAELLLALREVGTLSALQRLAEPAPVAAGPAADDDAIAFGAADFLAAPGECLAPLLAAGLLLEEGGDERDRRLLALPVSFDRRPTQAGWTRTRV